MPKDVDLFDGQHNAAITWEHLLRQTSDWSGTLWGKPDWADRPPRDQTVSQWQQREMHEPGTFYKYNDTRVNVLALSALHVLKRPLPEVLDQSRSWTPIGASSDWHWEAYDNAWVEIEGKRMKSVTGGGHFGGGHVHQRPRHGAVRLPLPAAREVGRTPARCPRMDRRWPRSPGPANTGYGFCNWFLNNPSKTRRRNGWPASVPVRAAVLDHVSGQWRQRRLLDWDNDLLMVVRWIDSNRSLDQFIGKVIGAISKGRPKACATLLDQSVVAQAFVTSVTVTLAACCRAPCRRRWPSAGTRRRASGSARLSADGCTSCRAR